MSEIECTNTRDANVSLILHNLHPERESFHKSITIQGSDQYLNPMTILTNSSFGLLRVEELSILYTRLQEIEEAAFAPHIEETLKELIITRTHLQEESSFRGIARLRRLHSLSLSNNKLQHVPSNAFSPQQVNLVRINLQGNEIQSIASDAFSGLSNLELLVVSENKISFLGASVMGSVRRRKSLLFLLDNNLLKSNSFCNNTFSGGDKIRMLSLRDNPLDEVVKQVKPILEGGGRVDMRNSPLSCTCASSWLVTDVHFKHRCRNCLCPSGQDVWTFFTGTKQRSDC